MTMMPSQLVLSPSCRRTGRFFRIPMLFLLLLLSSSSRVVEACGGFFCQPAQPVIQTGESIVFGVNGTQVRMIVQINYEGPAEGFSWVLPVPFVPTLSVGSDRIFTALFARTLPTFQLTLPAMPGSATETCSEEALQQFDNIPCPVAFAESAAGGGPTILEQGSVGPFDFTILEAAENDPGTVFEWLQENGYDQPAGADALLNYYALHDHVFVALRLSKDADSGDIQPLIMEYDMTPSPATKQSDTQEELEAITDMPIACVPIQLTRIAAMDKMPIQVYILGNARAAPLNYIEMELDDTQVDWLTCNFNPRCYDDDYRERFDRAASDLVNHTFITEYAGPAGIMANQIAIPLTREQILESTSEQDFVNRYGFLLPNNPLVAGILQEFAPLAAQNIFNSGQPVAIDADSEFVFNATALADELHVKVLQPALDDQRYVDSFANLTRLYGRLGPESMTKDPFFAFQPDLPPVDNVHRATSEPVCLNDTLSGLAITVEQGGGGTVTVPAVFSACTGWTAPGNTIPVPVPLNVSLAASPARQLASYGFAGTPSVVLTRQPDGFFDAAALGDAIDFGDSLVLDQTIPEYMATDATVSPDTSNTTAAPTASTLVQENTTAPVMISTNSTTEAPTVAPVAVDATPVPAPSNTTTAPTDSSPLGPNSTTTEPTQPPTTEPTSAGWAKALATSVTLTILTSMVFY